MAGDRYAGDKLEYYEFLPQKLADRITEEIRITDCCPESLDRKNKLVRKIKIIAFVRFLLL